MSGHSATGGNYDAPSTAPKIFAYQEVARLTAERDRYREALETIIEVGNCYSLDGARTIARAALDGEA
jgi:hypothetical protein